MPSISCAIFVFLAALGCSVKATCVDGTIDCLYQQTAWSDCDPCTNTRSRFINVTRARHGHGAYCPGAGPSTSEPCDAAGKQCSGQNCDKDAFHCVATGTCIRKDLVCNGDNDCGDYTDELNCTQEQRDKRADFVKNCVSLSRMPHVDLPLSGFDVLTGQFVGRLLTADYYGGECRNAFNPDMNTEYRLPYNFNTFHFQTITDGTVDSTSYDSYQNYKARRGSSKDIEFELKGSGSIKKFDLDLDVSFTKKQSELDIFKSMSENKSSLFEMTLNVQLASFQLRQTELMLDPEFRSTIYRLPTFYNPQIYFNFFKNFGTHYVVAGTMGGKLRKMYVIEKSVLKTSHLSSEDAEMCLNVEAGMKFRGYSANLGFKYCDMSNKSISNSNYVSSLSKKLVSDDQGGTSGIAFLFVPDQKVDADMLKEYITGVQTNPAVLKKRLVSICDLIPESRMDQYKKVKDICDTAIIDYFTHHGTSTCQPCSNDGVAVKVNQTCYCACPSGVVGQLCQLPEDKKQPLNIRSDNPVPFMIRNSTHEHRISRLRARYDKVYALADQSGTINVYTNYPWMSLERIINSEATGIKLANGFDVDDEGRIWTLELFTGDVIVFDEMGNISRRISKDNISNYCWGPVDIATTCDGYFVIADNCGGGRFFVLRENGTLANVLQYNDGETMPEQPISISSGPTNELYIVGQKYVTVFAKVTNVAPYTFQTKFLHGVENPGQLFVDETNRAFLSCAFNKEEEKKIVFMAVFNRADGYNYVPYTTIQVDKGKWGGGCSGLAGSGSEIFTACSGPGLTIFRTI